MLENARRQLFLVLLSIVAGLVCSFTMKIPLGHDLKGGTQLRYEVPKDALEAMKIKEGTSIDKMMEDSIKVIAERIDPNGVLDPYITRSGDNSILIELPWFENPAELNAVIARIGNLGKLEFRMVADDEFVMDDVKFNMTAEKARLKAWLAQPAIAQVIRDDFRNIRRFQDDENGPVSRGNLAWYPRLIKPDTSGKRGKEVRFWERRYSDFGPPIGAATVPAYDEKDWNNGIIPDEILKRPAAEQFLVEYIALNMKETHFEGKDLDPGSVGAGNAPEGGVGVHYAFDAGHSGAYAEWSDRYKGKPSAIVLNGIVKSAPTFQGKIIGTGIITGDFTIGEVDELVKVLKTGSLRVEPVLLSRESIGPTLGKAAILRGAWSLLAGTLLVFGFMLWYYRVAGTVACVTLTLNIFLLWASMLFMQATITLPGLGGIVLTMGMAVDANVLIYERIREELAKGKDLLRSVRAGFERAMSAILDSNITTFLAGVVLYAVGVGPVKGFAVTLMVGIVTTVFTQFFVTRLLFHYALERNWLVRYHPRSLFTNVNIDFVRLIKPCFIGSGLLITVGLVYALAFVPRGVMLGIDFTGGADLRMVLATSLRDEDVRDRISKDAEFARDYADVQLNHVGDAEPDGSSRQFNVRVKLDDVQRKRIERERTDDTKKRSAARDAGEATPAAYEPPYVVGLRRIFHDQLVKPAFSAPQLTLQPPPNDNLQWAQIDVFLTSPIEVATVQEKLAKTLARVSVKPITDAAATRSNDLRIEWTTQKDVKEWEIPGLLQKELAGVQGADKKPLSLSEPFPDANEIEGRLVSDLRNSAIGSLILAWLLIVLYLRVRFHEYKYGIGAVVALIHDVLVAFVAAVFFNSVGWVSAEIDLSMIACFLTIIGYSVNDTIVIFDRIRENEHENARLGVTEPSRVLINRALNQTMSRTILTSGLTLLVVVAQFLVNWGSDSNLESFAFAMMIGMISGVYSSVYMAAPILIWLEKKGGATPHATAAVSAPATTPAS